MIPQVASSDPLSITTMVAGLVEAITEGMHL
jgi:hypothetical protein